MKNTLNLIGLSGQMQHGKDTVADMILRLTAISDMPPYHIVNGQPVRTYGETLWKTRRFAGILKKMTALVIGCELADLERDEFKNKPLGEEWRRWYFTNPKFVTEYSDDNPTGKLNRYFSSEEEALTELHSEILTPRLILQLLGTEGGRDVIHPNIWVNATLGNLTENDFCIVTDVRFPNEVEGIKKRKGIVVRVVRPSKVSTSTHPSETALNEYQDWDYVIINDGTLEDLEEKVIDMLEHFGIPIVKQSNLR